MKALRRFVFSPTGNPGLPLIVESIGYNPSQEKIIRSQGYPWYHWLQVEDGEGVLTYHNETVQLSPYSGVLLPSGLPHIYESSSNNIWSTLYLTFGGDASASILSSFGIHEPAIFYWEPSSPFVSLLSGMLSKMDDESDMFGLDISVDAYRFLGQMSKLSQGNHISISRNMEKLTPLIKWMERHYGNPDIGLDNLAAVLGISSRHLSKLFHLTFGLAPYTYFVQMRIHKAKERLASEPIATVASIASQTGFRDTSHFVATFRKHTGMTPQQFRRLH